MQYSATRDKIAVHGPGSVSAYKLPLLTEALVRHGSGDDDIKKILGGNLFRLYEQVLG